MRFCLFALLTVILSLPTTAADWPQWRFDAGRGAASPAGLPETLHLQWTRQLPAAMPAWPEHQTKLRFDVAPEPVVSGRRMFVPSTVNDNITAYDTRSGEELWRFYADSPVRFAPLAHGGRVYFVSDDGHLYCLNAADGKLVWKLNGGPAKRWIIGNHRLVSSWPARGGPVLQEDKHGGKLYFAASVWPFMGIFIHAVDPGTGKIVWTNSGDGTNFIPQPHGGAISFATVVPQGYLAVDGDNLIIPGGRSTPAVYDAHNGKLKHFSFNKRHGGYAVSARGGAYFVSGMAFAVENARTLDAKSWALSATPTVHDDKLLIAGRGSEVTVSQITGVKESVVRDRRGNETKVRQMAAKASKKLRIDGGPQRIFIKAGNRIYNGGKDQVAAADLDGTGKPSWKAAIEGEVWNMLAADDRLFVVTTTGGLHCFGGEKPANVTRHDLRAVPALATNNDPARAHVKKALEQAGTKHGHAVVLGTGTERLAEELLWQSEMHVIVVDPDAKKVDAIRRKMQSAGLYGRRVSAHVGDLATFKLPPYMANLIVAQGPIAGLTAARVFSGLRPYGGTACLEITDEEHPALGRSMAAARLENAKLHREGNLTWLTREGALPGADDWTHQYASAAQAAISKDKLVKAPLGVLWFGGPDHLDVLPRHGHGPSPQVAGGRLFIEGPDMLRAVDVYTGRVHWQRELKDFGKYYNTTRHFPGAGEIGSNYVSLPERIYAVYGTAILELDAATGKTLKELTLKREPGQAEPYWGYLGVSGDLLVATSSPVDVAADDGKRESTTVPQTRFSSGSRRLVVFNRHTGKQLWSRDARFNFRHNNIAVAAGKVFCIDSITEAKRRALARRGVTLEGKPVLYALDAKTGDVVWSTDENVFGTFLNYSAEHDILLQAGSQYRDRARDEVGRGMAAYRGADGKVLWKNDTSHGGPCLLWRDRILTNGGGGFAIDIRSGESTGWRYRRAYGCNTAVGSEHLLTFRSGAAGFYDLLGDSGTGNFGGFKSSCTNNLIPAGGVLNAPDYTRTCSCAYQNQTSLALVHMPENEYWTFGGEFRDGRVGINFGAPGDRRDPSGTLWVDFPKVGGPSADVAVEVEPKQPDVFRYHSSAVTLGELKWVAASGLIGVRRILITVEDDAEYKLTLHFFEPDPAVRAGQRRFDVALDGKAVLSGFDVAKEAGGPRRAIAKTFTVKSPNQQFVLKFDSKTDLPPVVSGIELVRQE